MDSGPFLESSLPDRSFRAYIGTIRSQPGLALKTISLAAFFGAAWLDEGLVETLIALACALAIAIGWYPIWRARRR